MACDPTGEQLLDLLRGVECCVNDLVHSVCSVLSPQLSPIDLVKGAVFNADVFRDSMLIDMLPHTTEPYPAARGDVGAAIGPSQIWCPNQNHVPS